MLMLRSVFVVWAAMAGCRPPVLRLPPGLVPQLSPDLPRGQVVGGVVDSASRSAIIFAQVALLSDSSDASPSSGAAAGYTDEAGRFSLQASKPGAYTLQVRHIGHRFLPAPLSLPESGGSTSASFETNIYEFASQTQTTIDTLVVPLAQLGPPLECVELNHQGACVGSVATSGVTERAVAALAFPSVGGRLLLVVSYGGTRITGLGAWEPCTSGDTSLASCRGVWWEEDFNRAELWAVDLRTRQPTYLWPIPAGVYWFGVSEDGSQLVSGEGIHTTAFSGGTYTDPGTIRGCGVRYRSMADGTEVAPAIVTADACAVGAMGHGTVAPVAPRPSSP